MTSGNDRYRNDDWDTSVAAGDGADPRGVCRAAVLLAHEDHPDGLTDGEMGAIVDRRREAAGKPLFPIDSMRKRRTDLYHDGALEDTGDRRASTTGRAMVVWRFVEAVDRKPNPRRGAPAPVDPDVRRAIERVEAWAASVENMGMLVEAPDFADLRVTIATAKAHL